MIKVRIKECRRGWRNWGWKTSYWNSWRTERWISWTGIWLFQQLLWRKIHCVSAAVKEMLHSGSNLMSPHKLKIIWELTFLYIHYFYIYMFIDRSLILCLKPSSRLCMLTVLKSLNLILKIIKCNHTLKSRVKQELQNCNCSVKIRTQLG